MTLSPSRASAVLVAAAALQLQATTTAIAISTAGDRPPRPQSPRVAEERQAQPATRPPPPLPPHESRPPPLPPRRHPRDPRPRPEPRRRAGDAPDDGAPSAAAAAWYPDWVGGTNVCLRDGPLRPAPGYMSQQKLLKDGRETCCDSYYWWDAAFCLAESAASEGGAAEDAAGDAGSREWYADYGGLRCVQDCPAETEGLRCGGRLDPPAAATTAATTAATSSTAATTTTTTTTTIVTVPSNSNSSAVAQGTLAPPPLRHLAVAATFATATTCCQSNFPSLALGLCVASSESEDEYAGSGDYYVDYGNGRCVQDCSAPTNSSAAPDAGAGICGGIVTESATDLYADPAACCAARLSYLDPLLCATRSAAGGGEEGTFRLYPSFNTGTCVIDHDPAAAICSIGYACRRLRPTAWISRLYPVSPAGVATCCAEGLAFVNPSYCRARTMGVVSNKWFVDYMEQRCFQDCEAGGGASCVVNRDPTATYYDTPAACCASRLGYLNQPRCRADSTGAAYEGTGQFYVDYAASACVQDCPAAGDAAAGAAAAGARASCGGVVQDSSTRLHEDALWCCAKDLGYMNLDVCVDRSNGTSTGTGLYYPSGDGDSFCVKDTSAVPCPRGETCRRVDGWLSTVYDSIAECCQSGDPALPANESPAYCQALSTGAGTEKWFKNEGDAWCAKHCGNATDAACAVPAAPPSSYYDTARDCCAARLGYLNGVTCAELSQKGGVLSALVGTDEYYVDWMKQKCIKNCPAGNGVGCGGIAGGHWVDLHPDVTSCCAVLHYIDQEECVEASTSG